MQILAFKRKIINTCAMVCFSLLALATFSILIWILCYLINMGGAEFKWTTLTSVTSSPGQSGGLLNAIIGSFMMSTCAVILGGPLGILLSIYLCEYRQQQQLSKFLRYIIDILLGAPAIIFGLFIYSLIVIPMGHFSGWAGTLALTLIVIPYTAKTTESIYALIPNLLKESVLALGASHFHMIQFMIFKIIRSSIVTGLLLSFSRILGEAAPLIFTSLNNQFLSLNMNKPMGNLPLLIFNYAMSPYEDWHHLAWHAALLIAIIVLIMNILCRYLMKRHQ
ncbi:MAG: phosphate ABC transporter permease PstA [Gammaproteobacteria bacterium]|nr:phosphate ABC transporter permease PstA [Gammaproteobacteria bacterium]